MYSAIRPVGSRYHPSCPILKPAASRKQAGAHTGQAGGPITIQQATIDVITFTNPCCRPLKQLGGLHYQFQHQQYPHTQTWTNQRKQHKRRKQVRKPTHPSTRSPAHPPTHPPTHPPPPPFIHPCTYPLSHPQPKPLRRTLARTLQGSRLSGELVPVDNAQELDNIVEGPQPRLSLRVADWRSTTNSSERESTALDSSCSNNFGQHRNINQQALIKLIGEAQPTATRESQQHWTTAVVTTIHNSTA